MSTRPRDSKTTAKRRAAARRRTREIGRYVFTYSMIGILVLGIISSVVILQAPQTVAPVQNPTPTAPAALQDLLTKGDQAFAAANYQEAISFYRAYLDLNIGQADANAEINYRLGKSYLNIAQPDYAAAIDHLQRALNIDPNASWAAEANELIKANLDKLLTPTVVTGTVTLTGTAVSPGASVTATQAITATDPITVVGTPVP